MLLFWTRKGTNDSQRWYFLTPLKVKDNGSGVTKKLALTLRFRLLLNLMTLKKRLFIATCKL